jgi:hypothetical protein
VRAKCRAAADNLLGEHAASALFAAEVRSFPGRLGIMHRDLPPVDMRTSPSRGVTSCRFGHGYFPTSSSLLRLSGQSPTSHRSP